MPLAFGFSQKPGSVVTDGHGRNIIVAVNAAHRNDNRVTLAAGEGMIIAISNDFSDDDAERRHRIEIKNDGVAVAGKLDAVARYRLKFREIEA